MLVVLGGIIAAQQFIVEISLIFAGELSAWRRRRSRRRSVLGTYRRAMVRAARSVIESIAAGRVQMPNRRERPGTDLRCLLAYATTSYPWRGSKDELWDAISAVVEVFGLAAVVISVLYLASQTRQQTREIRIAAIHEVPQNFTDSVTPYLDPQVSDLWARGTKNFDVLTEAERIQMISVFTINLRSFLDACYQAVEDRLDKQVWEGIVNFYGSVLSTPGAERIWELRKHTFSATF